MAKNTQDGGGLGKILAIAKSEIWRAIRAFCLECTGSYDVVKGCNGDAVGCPLYSLRMGKSERLVNGEGKLPKKFYKRSLLKTIRDNCRQCVGSQKIQTCTSPNCSLYDVRWGNN